MRTLSQNCVVTLVYTGREDAGSSPAAATIILYRDLLCPVFPR